MNKYLLLVCMFLTVLLGCSSNKYGYSIETWNNLTQLERNKIETEASENVKNMKEEERERGEECRGKGQEGLRKRRKETGGGRVSGGGGRKEWETLRRNGRRREEK